MSYLGIVFRLFIKDIKIERRAKEIVSSTLLFALLVVLLSAFAFDLNAGPRNGASAGVLYIAVTFSGLLALSRTYLREREFNVWRAMLMLPVPRSALFLGKMLGVFTFLLVVSLALIPIIEIFFHSPMISHLHLLLPILVLSLLGFSAVGSLFGAMSIHTRLRDILLGVILYPLTSPLLIAAVKGTEAVLMGDGLAGARIYLDILVLIDIIYIFGGVWLFGPLMED